MDTTTKILGFLGREMNHGERIEPDQHLFDSGVVDSFSILDLAMFVEEEFGIPIEPGDVVLENFATVQRLASFIDGRRPMSRTA